jgi:hypothetical protein
VQYEQQQQQAASSKQQEEEEKKRSSIIIMSIIIRRRIIIHHRYVAKITRTVFLFCMITTEQLHSSYRALQRPAIPLLALDAARVAAAAF